jgi:LacI family transcriptional regulator
MPTRKQITIKQGAQEAGVSTQTVSRVLNDRPDVSPETRQLVQDVINRLGYQPSAIARSLIRRRSHSLGVVVAELGQYGPSRRLMGIENEADSLGYRLHLNIMHDPRTSEGERLLNDLLSWRVEGVIWAVPEIGDNRAWLQARISLLSVPIVCINEQPQSVVPAVSVNNRAAGRLATEHLLEQGYRHIGHITGPLNWEVARQRQLGWQDSLPGFSPRQLCNGDWSAASGENGLRQLLSQFPELDAIFASNDQTALGVLQAAHQSGLRVPEDLGLVGFDNIPESAYYWPPLTTVRHQLREQGQMAVRELVNMIEGDTDQQNSSPTQLDHQDLQPLLIVRKSSIR